MDKKIISIFEAHSKKIKDEKTSSVMEDSGYNCIVFEKDDNAIPFNISLLRKYKELLRYIVRVARIVNGRTMLYNYDVSSEDFCDFIKKIQNKTIEGEIIEIDKYVRREYA